MLERAGIDAYFVTADAFGAELVALANAGVDAIAHRDFLVAFERADWADAVAELESVLGQSGRLLSAGAGCALCDAVRRAGTPLGGLDATPASDARLRAWTLRALPRLLGHAGLGERALSGGFAELRAAEPFELGALPVELLRDPPGALGPEERAGAEEQGWAEQLLELARGAERAVTAGDEGAVVFVPRLVAPPTLPAGEPSIAHLLARGVTAGASDLLITEGRPPLLRVDGRLVAEPGPPLTPDAARRMAYAVLSDAQVARLERDQALRAGFGVRGLGRFRITAFVQRGCVAASVRVLSRGALSLEALGLPPTAIVSALALRSGLLLVAGAAGSGRTTTAAALAARFAQAGRSVLTLEEPIELVLPHGEGVVSQVEVGPDAMALSTALAVARDLEAQVVLLDQVDDPARLDGARALVAQGRLVVSTISATEPRQALERAGGGVVLWQALEPRADGPGRALRVEPLLP
jgi:hypothetical protein